MYLIAKLAWLPEACIHHVCVPSAVLEQCVLQDTTYNAQDFTTSQMFPPELYCSTDRCYTAEQILQRGGGWGNLGAL